MYSGRDNIAIGREIESTARPLPAAGSVNLIVCAGGRRLAPLGRGRPPSQVSSARMKNPLPAEIFAMGWNMLVHPIVCGHLVARREDFAPELAKLTPPLLVTYGASDIVILPSMAELVTSHARRCQVQWHSALPLSRRYEPLHCRAGGVCANGNGRRLRECAITAELMLVGERSALDPLCGPKQGQ